MIRASRSTVSRLLSLPWVDWQELANSLGTERVCKGSATSRDGVNEAGGMPPADDSFADGLTGGGADEARENSPPIASVAKAAALVPRVGTPLMQSAARSWECAGCAHIIWRGANERTFQQ
jgi:hypothetical protein